MGAIKPPSIPSFLDLMPEPDWAQVWKPTIACPADGAWNMAKSSPYLEGYQNWASSPLLLYHWLS